MGLYDTMQQGKLQPLQGSVGQLPLNNALGAGVGNGGSFAQKQQMAKNPMMKRPGMGAAFGQPRPQPMNTGQANPMAAMGQAVGAGGSNSMMQQKMQQLKNQQAGTTSGSYSQMVGANPQLQQMRETGQSKGQDMGWMDKPNALVMAAQQQQQAQKPQYGLQDVASRMNLGGTQVSPDGQSQTSLYGGDPRVHDMGPNNIGRPDVMDRGNPYGGIGPSAELFGGQSFDQMNQQPMQQPPVVMDENGLEPRRGAR
jgi:hypothetical protein